MTRPRQSSKLPLSAVADPKIVGAPLLGPGDDTTPQPPSPQSPHPGGYPTDMSWDANLDRLRASLHRKVAAELDMGAAAREAGVAMSSFNRALSISLAAFEAERAVAHFEGRIPPSLEVFCAQTEES